jgi:hypothetical protein
MDVALEPGAAVRNRLSVGRWLRIWACFLVLSELPGWAADESGTRRALIVGLGRYAPAYGQADLPAATNDAAGLHDRVLRGDALARWPESNTVMLADAGADKAAIRAAIGAAAAASRPGDVFFYAHAGRGGRQPGGRAFLCAHDTDYSADEFGADLAEFDPDATVVVLLAASHAAGMYKGTAWAFAEQALAACRRTADDAGRVAPGPNVGILTACDSGEYAAIGSGYSLYVESVMIGCDLQTTDADGSGQLDFNEIHGYAALRTLALNPDQHPQAWNIDLLARVPARTAPFEAAGGIWHRLSGDFDGDGAADLAVYSPTSGRWYAKRLTGAVTLWAERWGGSGFEPVPGDYDGDGRADLALYTAGAWFIRTAAGAILAWAVPWGGAGFTVVPGDYDGDGRADLAVYSQASGAWFVASLGGNDSGFSILDLGWNESGLGDSAASANRQSKTTNSKSPQVLVWNLAWGGSGFEPVSGDFDGDGRSDFAVYGAASGQWFIQNADGVVLAWGESWGAPELAPVPGDYDGDGRTDLAVYGGTTRNWYIRTVAGTVLAWGTSWGGYGLIPAPGDYDGDGRADLAVVQAGTGYWFIRSLAGQTLAWAEWWGY